MLMAVGIIGIYLSRVFIETKQRPYTIVSHVYERSESTDRDHRDGGPLLLRPAAAVRRHASGCGLEFRRVAVLAFQSAAGLLPVSSDADPPASLIDYGCGYGALADYLAARGGAWSYRGFDVSAEMIAAAEAGRGSAPDRSYTVDPATLRPADFVVASGIFNVKLDHPVDAWRAYVWDTIATLNRLSRQQYVPEPRRAT